MVAVPSGPETNVIGVDMFQESLDFTSERIRSAGLPIDQWHPVCGAVGDSPGDLTLRHENPLEGTNNTFTATGSTTRVVKMDTFGSLAGRLTGIVKEFFLLKIDISKELGGLCLKGADGDFEKDPICRHGNP